MGARILAIRSAPMLDDQPQETICLITNGQWRFGVALRGYGKAIEDITTTNNKSIFDIASCWQAGCGFVDIASTLDNIHCLDQRAAAMRWQAGGYKKPFDRLCGGRGRPRVVAVIGRTLGHGAAAKPTVVNIAKMVPLQQQRYCNASPRKKNLGAVGALIFSRYYTICIEVFYRNWKNAPQCHPSPYHDFMGGVLYRPCNRIISFRSEQNFCKMGSYPVWRTLRKRNRDAASTQLGPELVCAPCVRILARAGDAATPNDQLSIEVLWEAARNSN